MKKEKRERISSDIIEKRKYELFRRDPLVIEMDSLYRAHKRDDSGERMLSLESLIPKKWNCSLIPQRGEGALKWFSFHSNHKTVHDLRDYINEELIPFLKSMYPSDKTQWDTHGYVFHPYHGGLDHEGTRYVPIPKNTVPLLVDIGGLSLKSKGKVLDAIWNVISAEIKAQGIKHIPQVGDMPDVALFYNMKEEVFQQYLKWYDLHMGGNLSKPEGLNFRQIAFLTYAEKTMPDRLEEVKQGLARREKKVRSRKGEKVIKGYVGEPMPREDSVALAVKTIYKAIHRKDYPKKAKIKSYTCPVHGSECPRDCDHLLQWMQDFNRRYMLFKPLMTSSCEKTVDWLNYESKAGRLKSKK